MPETVANGIHLAYDIFGEGDPVLLVAGTGQPANTWHIYQMPALVDAGFKVITFDNRGVAPSDCPPPPYTISGMVEDAAGLIQALGLAPCRVVGMSLGAIITQELALAHPELVRSAVMMGTVGRLGHGGQLLTNAWVEMDRTGIVLPPLYDAMNQLAWLFAPATLANEEFVATFVELILSGPPWSGDGRLGQHLAEQAYGDRLEALAGITVPSMVMTFEFDSITLAPMGREVAAVIKGCELVEISAAGHGGMVEKPDEVNAALIEFLKNH
jgi:pimeloyl-ACP methyl ester carboxylesterase